MSSKLSIYARSGLESSRSIEELKKPTSRMNPVARTLAEEGQGAVNSLHNNEVVTSDKNPQCV